MLTKNNKNGYSVSVTPNGVHIHSWYIQVNGGNYFFFVLSKPSAVDGLSILVFAISENDLFFPKYCVIMPIYPTIFFFLSYSTQHFLIL